MGPIKAAGKYHQEGKTYVVQDGDIIHFQFSELIPRLGEEMEMLICVDVAPKK